MKAHPDIVAYSNYFSLFRVINKSRLISEFLNGVINIRLTKTIVEDIFIKYG